jgi:hypothetical protein
MSCRRLARLGRPHFSWPRVLLPWAGAVAQNPFAHPGWLTDVAGFIYRTKKYLLAAELF